MSEQEKAVAGAKKPAKAQKPSVIARIGKWGRDLKSEVKKVVWPDKKQVVNNTGVVILTIAIIGVIIWIADFVFNLGIRGLFQLFS